MSVPRERRRRAVPLLALLVGVTLPGAAVAQDAAPRIRVGLGGGVLVPRQGASVHAVRPGLHAQGFVLVRLPGGLPPLRVNLDAGGHWVLAPARPSPDSRPAPPGTPNTEHVARVLHAGTLGTRVEPWRGALRPYAVGGVGVLRLHDDAAPGLDAPSQTQLRLAVEGGLGLALRLRRLEAFAEARVRHATLRRGGLVDRSSGQTLPLTVGLTF